MSSFNPFEQSGIPLDRQTRNWSEINSEPYDKRELPAYSECRVIVMNGIEVEAVMFSHQFTRNCDNTDIKRQLAEVRRIEQQQQKAINWLTPGNESTLEITIGYEQVAVDLTAWLAQNEPDPYVKAALEFGLLEDFDHLYRYANLYELLEGKKAEELVDYLTEIMPGRPTALEHCHPADTVNRPYDRSSVDPRTRLHVLTITAAEQQTMNFYMNIGNRPMEPIARGLYAEIAQIEEQHVTHYETLASPNETWLERLVSHEYNEVYLYHSFLQQEEDDRLRKLWELHLNMEIEQLKAAAALLEQHEGTDATEIVPAELPEAVTFEQNKQYVRDVISNQVDLRQHEDSWVDVGELPEDHRYFRYLEQVNGGNVPSRDVIERHRAEHGDEYRLESEGEHPIVDLRDPSHAS